MIDSFFNLSKSLLNRPPLRLVVVGTAEEKVLKAVSETTKHGWVKPVIISDSPEFTGIPGGEHHLVPDLKTAAKLGVELIKSGKADLLMKGNIATADLLHPVVAKNEGLLKSGKILSHVAFFELPGRNRLTLMSDAAVLIQPDLAAKAQIIDNALEAAGILGYSPALVAVLSALEKVNPKIPSSVVADQLSKLAVEGRFGSEIVSGPLALDNALLADAVTTKGITDDPVAGKADILIVPELVSGNLLYKSFSLIARYPTAGIVMGAEVPIILTSRADLAETKVNSIALGCYLKHNVTSNA